MIKSKIGKKKSLSQIHSLEYLLLYPSFKQTFIMIIRSSTNHHFFDGTDKFDANYFTTQILPCCSLSPKMKPKFATS